MYTLIDLGPGVRPTDIDEHGNVLVEYSDLRSPALVRNNGEVIDLAAHFGIPVGRAYGMNDVGKIVVLGNGGYVCDLATGVATKIPLTLPLAITNAGFVVGRDDGHPACVDPSSGERVFVFVDETHGSALGVNESGTMCGLFGPFGNSTAWRGQVGGPEALGLGIATAINDGGTVVGVQAGVGFVIDPLLGKLDVTPPSGGISSVLDIDDTGRHVGLMVTALGQRRGFVGHGSAAMDLTTLVAAASDVVVDTAVAVNNAGWIAATGWIAGALHGVLLKPIAPGVTRFRTLAALLHILQGGRLGNDGIAIGPGGVREPIPSGPLRDGIVGLALVELAELLDDRGTRAGVRALALERVEVALEQALGTTRARPTDTPQDCELGPGFPPLHEL